MSKRKRARAPKAEATHDAQDGRDVERTDIPAVPKWLPPTLFVGLTVFLFRDFIFSNEMLWGNDTLGLGYVARHYYAEILASGHIPRWAPLILGGVPFVESLSGGDAFYPPSMALLIIMETYRSLGWKLIIHIAAAGFFMFGWTRQIGASRPASLVASVGFMLAPFLVSLVHPGHDGKIFVTALAPLLFWAVERHFVQASIRTFTFIAFVVAMVIFTTHFQMAYFLFGAAGLFAIFRTAQSLRGADRDDSQSGPSNDTGLTRPTPRIALTRFGLFLAASVAGAAIAGVQLFPAVDYVMESSRRIQTTREASGEADIAWSSSWSMHPEEAMSLIIPEFVGNDANGSDWTARTYWGRNATRDNHSYPGLIILLLAAIAFVGGRRPGLRWFFTGLGLLAFLFAQGTHTPVWRLFYEFVRGISLFRAPDQVMFLFGFAVATLAALGVDRLIEVTTTEADEEWKKVERLLFAACGVLGLLAVAASTGMLTSVWTAVLYDLPDYRVETLQRAVPFIARGAWIAVLLGLGATGLAWAVRRSYLAPVALVAGLTLLATIDALRVDAPFIQTLEYEQFAREDANLAAVVEREEGRNDPYRLLSFRRGNGQDVMPALYGIELAAGHHPNDLSRYRELIGMVGSEQPSNLFTANPQIRRLLNVRYLLWDDRAQGGSLDFPVFSRTQLQDGTPFESIYLEDDLPRARLVGSAVVKSDEEAVDYMLSPSFDPENEVVLTEMPQAPLANGPVAGEVIWELRSADRMRLTVTNEAPALLVIADNWYPDWHATVDGQEAEILRAYHSLRAVHVPAGEHSIEMWYASEIVSLGWWLGVAVFFALLGAIGIQTWRDHRRERAA